MTKNNDFITIGELSKLTNVNAKSLRYYEKLGILVPAFVDPVNNYRYYTYSQIHLVSIIQFYVEMGIPLIELLPFIDTETGTVNLRHQMQYGIDVARQKIEYLQNQIEHAEKLTREMERCDHIMRGKGLKICKTSVKICYALPIHGSISKQQYYTLLQHMYNDLRKADVHPGSETGILNYADEGERKSYVYIDTDIAEQSVQNSRYFIKIPAQKFYCERTAFENMNYPWLEQRFGYGRIPYLLTLSELLTSEYDSGNAAFELRWNAEA